MILHAGTLIQGTSGLLPNKCPDVPLLEAEINKPVYALYELTSETIEIVEGKE